MTDQQDTNHHTQVNQHMHHRLNTLKHQSVLHSQQCVQLLSPHQLQRPHQLIPRNSPIINNFLEHLSEFNKYRKYTRQSETT